MRNLFSGPCYRCGGTVPTGGGHFERFRGGFRVQHAACAIQHRGTPDPDRLADQIHRAKFRAVGTGKKAQRARHFLRGLNA